MQPVFNICKQNGDETFDHLAVDQELSPRTVSRDVLRPTKYLRILYEGLQLMKLYRHIKWALPTKMCK